METKCNIAVCAVSDHFLSGGVLSVRKRVRGSFTVEAAIIVPVILFMFGILLHILFYWHDKNILMSTAHETAVLGSGREGLSEIELEYYFFSRMEGKLLLFDRVECVACLKEEEVVIAWDGSKDSMRTKGQYSISRTEPESDIRSIRKIEKLGEGIVK